MRVHNACIPLTNIRHLPFDFIDSTAITFYYARMAMAKIVMSAYNFNGVVSGVEM